MRKWEERGENGKGVGGKESEKREVEKREWRRVKGGNKHIHTYCTLYIYRHGREQRKRKRWDCMKLKNSGKRKERKQK